MQMCSSKLIVSSTSSGTFQMNHDSWYTCYKKSITSCQSGKARIFSYIYIYKVINNILPIWKGQNILLYVMILFEGNPSSKLPTRCMQHSGSASATACRCDLPLALALASACTKVVWTCTTPWKINMEPTNHPFRTENDLPNLHYYVPC